MKSCVRHADCSTGFKGMHVIDAVAGLFQVSLPAGKDDHSGIDIDAERPVSPVTFRNNYDYGVLANYIKSHLCANYHCFD
jgi:hypothetical protein